MNQLIEGKKWDAVKGHLKRNKRKYLLGAAAAGIFGVRAFNANANTRRNNYSQKELPKKYQEEKKPPKKYQEEKKPSSNTPPSDELESPKIEIKENQKLPKNRNEIVPLDLDPKEEKKVFDYMNQREENERIRRELLLRA